MFWFSIDDLAFLFLCVYYFTITIINIFFIDKLLLGLSDKLIQTGIENNRGTHLWFAETILYMIGLSIPSKPENSHVNGNNSNNSFENKTKDLQSFVLA